MYFSCWFLPIIWPLFFNVDAAEDDDTDNGYVDSDDENPEKKALIASLRDKYKHNYENSDRIPNLSEITSNVDLMKEKYSKPKRDIREFYSFLLLIVYGMYFILNHNKINYEIEYPTSKSQSSSRSIIDLEKGIS